MSKLADIMTRDVFTTGAEATVSEVSASMVKGRFGSAVVIASGWVSGIFTERDALRACAAGVDPSTATVGEWMTKDPTTAPPDMSSDEAAQIMASSGFRHLPVVEGSEVVGIVSLRDVLSTKIARSPR